jgi:mannosyltransferase
MIVADRPPQIRQFERSHRHVANAGATPSPLDRVFSLTPAREYVLLAAITLVAAALRFYKLGEWSFWIDEYYTLQGARHVSEWPIARLPLNILLTHWALQVFGTSEWSARLASASIGVLSVPLLYVFIRRLFTPAVALVAVLLLAVSPWHIYWSQNARFYTLLLLLYSLALLLFFFALERNRFLHLAGSLLLFLMATRERFLGAFFIPVVMSYVLGLWLLRLPRPPGLNRRLILSVLLPLALILIVDGVRFALGAGTIWVRSIRVILEEFVGHPIDSPARLLILILFNIGVPLATLALFGAAQLILNRSRSGLLIGAGAVVPPLLLATINPFAFTVDRYVFLVLPCWLILAGYAVCHLYRWTGTQGRLLAVGVLAMLLADAAGSHLSYFQLNNGNRLDWRGVLAYVQSRQAPGDVLVSTWPELGEYYTKQPVVSVAAIDPKSVAAGDRRYWFVIDSEAIWFAPGTTKSWIETNATLKEMRYLRTREALNLRVYLYDPAEKR